MQNKLIIYVDDETDLGEIFSEKLKNRGYLVNFFFDPHEAISFMKANAEKIGIAFVDYRLPGMTGIDLVHEVDPNYEVHIITGDLLASELIKDTRIKSILFKPFKFQNIKGILKERFPNL
jgi:DNA-binding NtrC family response regulator